MTNKKTTRKACQRKLLVQKFIKDVAEKIKEEKNNEQSDSKSC